MCSELPPKQWEGQIHAHRSHPFEVGAGTGTLCFTFSKYV